MGLPDALDRLPLENLIPLAPAMGFIAVFLAVDLFFALRHMRQVRKMAEARALASHARRVARNGRA